MLCVTADVNNLELIREFIEKYASALGMDPDDIYGMMLAADEAATNICVHGYAGKPGTIRIQVDHDAHDLIVKISDDAPPFDPTRVPPPKLTGPLEERPLGGLGIHFMRSYTDEIIHRVIDGPGNELTLKKRLGGGKKP
jgi:serine/threonine-protein kinase RsbW